MSGAQESENKFETLPNFYPPNDDKEDFELTRQEFEKIQDAFKDKGFRELLAEYVDEVQDPENIKIYQSEVRQLEKQNGNIVHFLNPIPGYVLKTSIDGHKKGFINICSNPLIRKSSIEQSTNKNSQNGRLWSIPYAQSPPREDVDKAGQFCQVFDAIFNPEVIYMGEQNSEFRKKIEETALEAVESSFKLTVDKNNVKKPKLQYKGAPRATVIKYKSGQEPPSIIDREAIDNEIPPQSFKNNESIDPIKNITPKSASNNRNARTNPNHKPMSKIERKLNSDDPSVGVAQERTAPRYSLKYRSHVDLQDCCFDNQKSGNSSKPIPDEIILTVDLPLLSDSSTLNADVLEDGWNFELSSEKKAFYELKLKLPFQVHPESAKATFDKDKRKLYLTMKTIQKKLITPASETLVKLDEDDVFDEEQEEDSSPKELIKEIEKNNGDKDVGYESTESNEHIPTVINGNIVVKSILKGSNNRSRSMSESWVDHHIDHPMHKDDYMSLESLSESNELLTMSESSGTTEKSVRFNENVQRQLYRSNSSILGQRKKNQKKNKSKRKNRERHSSEGSVSSYDGEFNHERYNVADESEITADAEAKPEPSIPRKHKKKPCELVN